MNEGAEEPDWVKHDRELESETEEALADLDAVVSGERPDLCEWCGFDRSQVKRAGERPAVIPDAAVAKRLREAINDVVPGLAESSRASQRLRAALRAAHPEADRAPEPTCRVHGDRATVVPHICTCPPEVERAPEDER